MVQNLCYLQHHVHNGYREQEQPQKRGKHHHFLQLVGKRGTIFSFSKRECVGFKSLLLCCPLMDYRTMGCHKKLHVSSPTCARWRKDLFLEWERKCGGQNVFAAVSWWSTALRLFLGTETNHLFLELIWNGLMLRAKTANRTGHIKIPSREAHSQKEKYPKNSK